MVFLAAGTAPDVVVVTGSLMGPAPITVDDTMIDPTRGMAVLGFVP